MNIKCFWLEPTGQTRNELQVFCSECSKSTLRELGDAPDGERLDWATAPWPQACDHCGHAFDYSEASKDWRSSGQRRYYRRVDTGEEGLIKDFGPGAMWDAHWMTRKGPDGRCLCVRLPGDHDWMVDSRCSNCNMKDVEHYCWERTGEVPNVTVGNGPAGHAGGGSVWANSPHGWHGFLRNGELVPA